ncbi:MAG: AzlD domain-containing protein [Pseudomonadota bacterium]
MLDLTGGAWMDGFLLLPLLAMAAATYLTRIGGVAIMSVVPLHPRVRRGLEALSGAVLIALVVPAAIDGDWGARVACIVALVAMFVSRNAVLAMSAGICAAIGVRAAGIA